MGRHQRSTTARGYGGGHKRQRERWVKVIARSGGVRCVCDRAECDRHDGQCPVIIRAGDAFDLGHSDDRRYWTGPECVGCNRAAGGRNGARVSNLTRQTVVRAW